MGSDVKSGFWRNLTHRKVFWPAVALFLLLVLNIFITPGFFNIQIKDGHLYGSLLDILNHATPLILISLGMTAVIATQGIDISVGSIIAISASVSATVLVSTGNVPMAIIAGLVAGFICGIWNGILVSYIGIQCMVGTLILYIVGRGIAQLITGGQILTFTDERFIYIGTGYFLGFPVACFVAAAAIFGVFYLLRKTALGLFVESIGSNGTASYYSGINSKRFGFYTYVLSGFLASIAGILICSNIKSADANNAGLWMELDAILATVIGGTPMTGGRFYLGGTVVGALFIQTLTTTIYSLGVPTQVTLVVKAVIVIIVCIVQTPALHSMLAGKKKRVAA